MIVNFDCIAGHLSVDVVKCEPFSPEFSKETMYNVGKEDTKEQTMRISEYIDYWKNYINSGYPSTMPLLYLKVRLEQFFNPVYH